MTTRALRLVAASGLACTVASAVAWTNEREREGEVLEFTAKWCGPCQQVSPVVSRLEREGLPIRKVDVDENPDLVRKYRIESMPTFVVLVGSKEIAREKGIRPEVEPIETKLRRLCAMIPARSAADRRRSEQAEEYQQPRKAPPGPTDAGDTLFVALDNSTARKPAEDSKPFFGLFSGKKEAPVARPAVARTQNEDGARRPEKSATPLEASVRIRVHDAQGDNFGSGTIIDSREGRAIVLTCGHIFRRLDKSSSIEVDVFQGERHKTFVGKLWKHDLEGDVGLITIAADGLPACRVLPFGIAVERGLPVETVGCSGGASPTVQKQNVTALNRYLGPDNIECSVVPVQGRSGGGLFNRDGQLIGVCMAADPQSREGLYAGVKTIHTLLDDCRLSHLYRKARSAGAESEPEPPASTVPPRYELAAKERARSDESADVPRMRTAPAGLTTAAAQLVPTSMPAVTGSRVEAQEALGAEVVVIIRPRNGQAGYSKVVMLNRASRRFVEYLSDELSGEDSLEQPVLAASDRAASPAVRQVRRPASEGTLRSLAERASSATIEAYRRQGATAGSR